VIPRSDRIEQQIQAAAHQGSHGSACRR
jgi:hypothetical protein